MGSNDIGSNPPPHIKDKESVARDRAAAEYSDVVAALKKDFRSEEAKYFCDNYHVNSLQEYKNFMGGMVGLSEKECQKFYSLYKEIKEKVAPFCSDAPFGERDVLSYSLFRDQYAADLTERKAKKLYADLAGKDGKLEGKDIDTSYTRSLEIESDHQCDVENGVLQKEGKNAIAIRLGNGKNSEDLEFRDETFSSHYTLADDCRRTSYSFRGYKAEELRHRGAEIKPAELNEFAYTQIENKIKKLVAEEGGVDGKVRKIVLASHGSPGTMWTNLQQMQTLPLEAVRLASIASQHIEPGGELILYGCNIAPDTKEGQEVRAGLAQIAKEHNIYIKTSSVQPEDGAWQTLKPIIICPDGEIVPDTYKPSEVKFGRDPLGKGFNKRL